jgi:hypothetical protein
MARQQRQIALHELLLQRLGAGGDHDLLARQQRRHEVRERLAGAGAGLDQRDPVLCECLLDSFGHRELLGALFVRSEAARQGAVFPQHIHCPNRRAHRADV